MSIGKMNKAQCIDFVSDLGERVSNAPDYNQDLLPKLSWLIDTLENITDFDLRRIRRDFSEQVTDKICPNCRAELPVSRFNRNRTTRDGFQYNCKMCQSEQQRVCRERKKNEQ